MEAFAARVLAHIEPFVSSGGAIAAQVVPFAAVLVVILADKRSYEQIASHALTPRRFYLRLMWWAQSKLDAFFRAPQSWFALDRCLLIALVYPVVFLLGAWVFGGAPRLGGDQLFGGGLSITRRILAFIALLAMSITLFVVLRYRERLADYLRRVLPTRIRDHWFVVGASAGLVVGSAIGVISKVLILGAGADAGAFAVAFAAAVTVAAAAAVPVPGIAAVVVAFAVAAAVLVAWARSFVVVAALASEIAIAFFVFLALLPLLNAVLDWASWYVSRRLLRHLVGGAPQSTELEDDEPRLRIGAVKLTSHGLFDGLAAVALLAAMALALPAFIQVLNGLLAVAGFAPVEWWVYLDDARAEPFGKGLFVTGMLLSTLLPTAAHALALGFCLVLPAPNLWHRGGRTTRLYDLLTKPEPTVIDRLFASVWLLGGLLVAWAVLIVTVIVLEALVWSMHLPFGTCLADMAQIVGQSLGPRLPSEAADYLAPITCELLSE